MSNVPPPSPPALSPQPLHAAYPAASPQKPTAGLAIASLILGIIAFLTGLLPVVGLVLGATSIVLGILALRKQQSTGMSVTALILATIAFLTSAAMTVGAVALATAGTSISAADSVATADRSTDSSSDSAQPTETKAPATKAAGTLENPHPMPYVVNGVFGGEKYAVMAEIIDANASEKVHAFNQFNSKPPKGYKYVLVGVGFVGIDKDGTEPSMEAYSIHLTNDKGNAYDNEWIVYPDAVDSVLDGPTLYEGDEFVGMMAFIVPKDAKKFFLEVDGEIIAFR